MMNSISDLEEKYLYKGSENPFAFTRTYDINFSCHFDLHDYPFDLQTCLILVTSQCHCGFFQEEDGPYLKKNHPSSFLPVNIFSLNGGAIA